MNKRRGLAYRGSSRPTRHQSVPQLERVEDRILMAIFDVTTIADNLRATAGDGTLRGEILASNATTTANEIDFQISGTQPITLVAPLPIITTTVFINGSTATSAPKVQVSGAGPNNFIAPGPAFTVNAKGSELRDLVINNFEGDGIDLNGGTSTVDGCYIGLDPTGTMAEPISNDGILVASAGNTIGGNAGSGNVIAATGGNAIEINGTNAGGNLVTSNFIGTNATGTKAVFSTVPGDGIAVSTPNNTIGGPLNGFQGTFSLGQGNLISGNEQGLLFFTGGNGNVAEGNFIGTDVTGKVALPNVDTGVLVSGGSNNTIGGINNSEGFASPGNVISGNGNDGVQLTGTSTTKNMILGNLIGVGSDGTTAVGNGKWGVQINASSNNQVGNSDVGGNVPGFGNTIENNDTLGGGGGVTIVQASGDAILSNSIFENGNGPGIALNGGNNGVKAPVITSVQSGAGETRITGTYSGSPKTTYSIQFFSSTKPNASGIGDGQNYLLADLPILTNSQGIATFSTQFSPQVPVGQFLTATATQGVLVTNNTSNFSTAVSVQQAIVSDLSVTTSVPMNGTLPAPPLLDQPYTYTLTIKNNGPNDSADVMLTDTLPTNAKVVSVSGGTVTGGVLTEDLGALAANGVDTVTIVVKPTVLGNFVNTATVTGPELDPDLTNNTSTTTSTVAPDADLEVTLTPSVNVAPVGSPITYTLSIGNNGPSTATQTVVTVQFPADFVNIVVLPDQGAFTISNSNLVTINTGIVPASSASNITFTVTPTAVETAIVTATALSPVIDPNPKNNSTSASVSVGNAADLAVSLAASPNPVLVGQELIYTAIVSNNGPSAASQPVLVDTLPAGLTYDPSKSSAGPNGTISFSGGVVTASLNALLPGDTDTITIAVFPTASALISNTVTVGDPTLVNPVEIDPNLANNVATATVPVSPADLSVDVINPNGPLFIGSNAVYQIQVTNSGPATATNVILNDMFSAGGNIVAVSAGMFSGGNYAANLGTFASGQMETIYIIVDPTRSGTLTNSASVNTTDEFDPDTSNNTSSSSNLVSPADISVSMIGTPTPIIYGKTALYVVTVTNNGPAAATNVLFGDMLPANAILDGLVASQGVVAPDASFADVFGNLGTLAPGASATVSINVLPLATGTSTNTAFASSDEFDTNPSNNSAAFAVPVINLPGTIQFDTTMSAVTENSGSITLLVDRINGTLGTVSANYFTANFTAVAGVNYGASSGTVTFAPNQSFATITIPILHDGAVTPNLGFFVGLNNPTGGASIGQQAVSGVIVVNTDRDLVPPVVTSLIAIPNGNQIDGFAIAFSKAMDPTEASNVSNYSILLTGSGAVNVGTPVPLAAAVYNASNNTVILVPTAPLPSNRFFEVVANGSVGNSLHDTSGNALFGSSGPATNYVAFYGQGTKLVYDDAQNNVVTLNLTGGGLMGIYRSANGDASQINLFGIVPHSTKLSGSVKKLNKNGSGHTFIGEINGFGQFGNVNSTLTTPQFFVGSAPVSASSVNVPLTVSTEPVKTTHVTPKKSTPKPPKHKH
jgi:uncharacterized repeat protein (TIGR01451 family)